MAEVTFMAGNFPSLFFLRGVRAGGGSFQGAGRRATASAVSSVANGAVGRVHFLAGCRRRGLNRGVLDHFLILILSLVLRGDRVGSYEQSNKQQKQFLHRHRFSPFETKTSSTKPKRTSERNRLCHAIHSAEIFHPWSVRASASVDFVGFPW